ncbi:MAG TPA: penicillin-binding protein 1B, partial [Gammaproteobacteria bacterium]|nr:penicillin-binding protein 1B [Gammaproteobacteria bacterium]
MSDPRTVTRPSISTGKPGRPWSIKPIAAATITPPRTNALPPRFVDLLIAVEDRGFYDHAGISVTGILRAALNNVLAGRFAQGGSTLTQPLVKNLYLTRERTLYRKALEALYAI